MYTHLLLNGPLNINTETIYWDKNSNRLRKELEYLVP